VCKTANNMSRVVSVDGTGMSLSQRFSALNKEKAQRRNVVNHQPVGAGINKRAHRFLLQLQDHSINFKETLEINLPPLFVAEEEEEFLYSVVLEETHMKMFVPQEEMLEEEEILEEE